MRARSVFMLVVGTAGMAVADLPSQVINQPVCCQAEPMCPAGYVLSRGVCNEGESKEQCKRVTQCCKTITCRKIAEPEGCRLACGSFVPVGWEGNDEGKNACNTCSCGKGGLLACTRIGCKDTLPGCPCTLSCGTVVQDGWGGNDEGPNACNLCGCGNGLLRCTLAACPPAACPKPTPKPTPTPTPEPTFCSQQGPACGRGEPKCKRGYVCRSDPTCRGTAECESCCCRLPQCEQDEVAVHPLLCSLLPRHLGLCRRVSNVCGAVACVRPLV